MKSFFESPERQAALDQAARAWKGTPYFANAASRGHGVGCVNLVHEILIEAGAYHRFELPQYQVDYGHHATQGQLLRFILDHEVLRGRLVFVPVRGRLQPGDLLACRSGRVDHHLALMVLWDQVVHAVENHGVIIHGQSEQKFAERVLYALRLLEP